MSTDARGSRPAGLRSLRSGFLDSAGRDAEAVALRLGDVELTYGRLDQLARRWANAIVTHVGGPAQRVGVFAHRSEVSYAGVLAALYSGAAFVPLNRTFPVKRTREMLRRAELDAVIVDEASADQLRDVLACDRPPACVLMPTHSSADPSVAVPIITRAELDAISPLDTLPPVAPDDIAYLLFTSGSTGEPSGVPVTHGNVRHFLDVMTTRYEIGPADRLSQTFDQTFDLSVFDLFVAWERGACVCAMQPIELLSPERFVRRHELTVWFSVPSVASLMRRKNLLRPDTMPTLRWSLFCGEPLPATIAESWQAAAPASIVENLYGPTELTIACLAHRWHDETSPASCVNGVVSIGAPYPGLTVQVVDEALRPVARGAIGELCVSGPQTTPGYWRNPEKTTERFVTLPDPAHRGVRFYRTGDRVRQLDDGEYVFMGRIDHQVKVLGHRVELAEIEAAIRGGAGVEEAVALGWPVVDGSAQGVVAFVCGTGIDLERLDRALRNTLPGYMTPGRIDVIDAMPLNANGKVDRAALERRLTTAPE